MAKSHDDYSGLAHSAALAAAATVALCAGLHRENAETARELRRLRADAERHRDALLQRLEREFVPPIDRRDLAVLAERLFDVAAAADEAYAAAMPLPAGETRTAATIAEKLKAGGEALAELIARLSEYQKAEAFQPLVHAARRQAAAAAQACGEAVGQLAQSAGPAGLTIARYETCTRLRVCADRLADTVAAAALAAVTNG